MTIETLTSLKLSFFILGFVLFFFLETKYSNRAWKTRRYKRLLFHSTIALFNTVIMRLPVLFILMPMLLLVTENQFGLLYLVADYNIYKFIISFLILDIAMYWWHRFNHKNQFLWRFHFVHHVDTHMDVGTSLRFHIGELILSTLYKSVVILFFGITLAEFLFYEIILVLSVQFHHSNIRINEKFDASLSKFIVTPKYHTNHHTRVRKSREANYASIFTIWDKIFLSYEDATDADREVMGLENREIELNLIDNLYHPFNKKVDSD